MCMLLYIANLSRTLQPEAKHIFKDWVGNCAQPPEPGFAHLLLKSSSKNITFELLAARARICDFWLKPDLRNTSLGILAAQVPACSCLFKENEFTGSRVHGLTGSRVHGLAGLRVHGLTGSQAHKLTSSQARELTSSRAHKLTSSRVHELTSSRARELTNSWAHELRNSRAHEFTSSQAHELTSSRARELTNSPAHELTSSRAHELTSSRAHELTSSLTRSFSLVRWWTRHITPPTQNGHAPPPIESRKSYQYVNAYYVWTWKVSPCWVELSRRLHSWRCPSVNSFKFQPCDHTPPRTPRLRFLIRCWRSLKDNDLQSLVGMV